MRIDSKLGGDAIVNKPSYHADSKIRLAHVHLHTRHDRAELEKKFGKKFADQCFASMTITGGDEGDPKSKAVEWWQKSITAQVTCEMHTLKFEDIETEQVLNVQPRIKTVKPVQGQAAVVVETILDISVGDNHKLAGQIFCLHGKTIAVELKGSQLEAFNPDGTPKDNGSNVVVMGKKKNFGHAQPVAT